MIKKLFNNFNFLGKLFLVIALIYPIVVFIIFPKWTVDDAYITFRYAENLANHGELNWNIGEKPVEGYTGIALPVIIAGFIKLGISPILASYIIGIAAFFLGWAMILLLFGELGFSWLIKGLILLLYSSIPILFTHSLSGLETTLFFSFVIVSIYGLVINLSKDKNKYFKNIFLFLSLFLLSLIRPEGVVLAGLIIASLIFIKYKYQREELKAFLISFFLIYFLPAILYFCWRLNYYGQFLPNTYYAKSVGGFDMNTIIDIARFIRKYFAVPLIAAAFLFFIEIDWLWNKIKNKIAPFFDRRITAIIVVGILFIALITFVLARSHLIMNYSNRFYVPFIPVFLIIIAFIGNLGFLTIKNFKDEKPIRYKFILISFILLFLYQIVFQGVKLRDEIRFANDQIVMRNSQHIAIGKLLKSKIPLSEWIVVYMDAGAIPYFSGLKTVDFGALNDRFLAQKNISLEDKINYFYSFNPAAAVFTSKDMNKLDYGDEAQAIVDDSRFKNYFLFKKYDSPISYVDYYEFVYLRKDMPSILNLK